MIEHQSSMISHCPPSYGEHTKGTQYIQMHPLEILLLTNNHRVEDI